MRRARVSVLMSTYKAETASNLADALESIATQSVLPDELVLVVDGSVGTDQEDVISGFVEQGAIPVILIRLPINGGLAEALNAGLKRCAGEFLMRMDSDDICKTDRLEKQLAYADEHPHIDVISAWSEEFFEDGAPSQLKVTPTNHHAIVRSLRWRNILCHPTLLVRKEALEAVNGYRATRSRGHHGVAVMPIVQGVCLRRERDLQSPTGGSIRL